MNVVGNQVVQACVKNRATQKLADVFVVVGQAPITDEITQVMV